MALYAVSLTVLGQFHRLRLTIPSILLALPEIDEICWAHFNLLFTAASSNQMRCLLFIFLGIRGANGAWDGLELSHIIEWKPHGTLGRPQQLKCNVRTERGKSGGRQGSRRWCAGGNWWETCQLDGCDCGVSRKGQRRGIYGYFSYFLSVFSVFDFHVCFLLAVEYSHLNPPKEAFAIRAEKCSTRNEPSLCWLQIKEALSVLMLCAPVCIFTFGSSALLGRPRCGLSIWMSLLAILNPLFWVYANLFHEKTDKIREYSKSAIFVDRKMATDGY